MKIYIPVFILLLAGARADISFNRDIRPILSENCFACHGPDDHERKADLRLDTREGAMAALKNGAAVVPGDPSKSLLIKRITHADASERMPAEESGKTLSPEQITKLKQWIAAGAEWQGHWAFIKPERPLPPKIDQVPGDFQVRNPIDAFVLTRQAARGLNPSPQASRETLIRRASLDLRGLPPTLAEIDAFVKDTSPDAYEKMIDRMLASKHYGEKMTRVWLDLARYGDTNGYHFDSIRPVWIWRDWVIRAFNENMPYDRFSIDQLAGDLYPNATPEQQIASGFNRNARFNEEGGADPDEWLVRYAIDRTSTLGQVWLGLTLNCAECHSHKYDPISQKEFYQLYAFFNSLEEVGAGGQGGFHGKPVPPFIKVPTPETESRVKELQADITAIETSIRDEIKKVNYVEPEEAAPEGWEEARDVVWVDDAFPGGVKQEGQGFKWVTDGAKSGSKAMQRVKAKGMEQHYFTKSSQPIITGMGDRLFAWVKIDPIDPPKMIMLQWNTSGDQPGWEHRAYWGEDQVPWGQNGEASKRPMGPLPKTGEWVRLEVEAAQVGIPSGPIRGMAFTQFDGTVTWDAAGLHTRTKQGPQDVVWIDDDVPPNQKQDGNWGWNTEQVTSGTRSMKRSGGGQHQHFFEQADQPLKVGPEDTLFAYVYLDPIDAPKTIMLQFNNGDWEHRAYWGEDKISHGGPGTDQPNHFRVGELPERGKWVRIEVPAAKVGLGDKPLLGWAFTQVDGTVWWDKAGVNGWSASSPSFRSFKQWLAVAPDELKEKPDALQHFIEQVFADTRSVFDPLHQQLEKAQAEHKKAENDLPMQLVSKELAKPRAAHVLIRGNFEKKGEQVERNVPAIFPPLPEGQQKDRMALAQWLMSPEHPLTARVTVNRLWAMMLGKGIVESEGDFGTQGNYPSHPALLDWLAVELVESDWDLQHILRLIAASSTYRQSSVNPHRYDQEDPDNILLSRAPRFRVSAEEVRDITLHAAGLLSDKVGGKPVFPFQPKDYYRGKKGGWNWPQSKDEDAYRRGMYTFWRRTTPYPTFMIFDMQDRSECVVKRARTNTPLQALTSLNEPLFVEAARALAGRVVQQAPDDRARAIFAFRLATGRTPLGEEVHILLESLQEEREHFTSQADAARKLVLQSELDPVDHAAWTVLANGLLNLDETITRE